MGVPQVRGSTLAVLSCSREPFWNSNLGSCGLHFSFPIRGTATVPNWGLTNLARRLARRTVFRADSTITHLVKLFMAVAS